MVCPQPVAIVRRCLVEMDPDEVLLVTGDYPPAERSIRRTCYRHGYAVSTETAPTADDDSFAVRIRVTETASQALSADVDD